MSSYNSSRFSIMGNIAHTQQFRNINRMSHVTINSNNMMQNYLGNGTTISSRKNSCRCCDSQTQQKPSDTHTHIDKEGKDYSHTHDYGSEPHVHDVGYSDTNNDDKMCIGLGDVSYGFCNNKEGCYTNSDQNICCPFSSWVDNSGCVDQEGVCISGTSITCSGVDFPSCGALPQCLDKFDNTDSGDGLWFIPNPKSHTSNGTFSWFGKFDIEGEGMEPLLHGAWAATDGKHLNTRKSILIKGSSRILLLNSPDCSGACEYWYCDDSPTIQVQPALLKLVGKRLQFDMLLQNMGGNLLGTLYLTSAPPSGNPTTNYCDTNPLDDGVNEPGYCTEIDIFEGNYYGTTSTLHVCDASGDEGCPPYCPEGSLPSCYSNTYPGKGCGHPDGCQSKSGGKEGWFTTESDASINSDKTFTVKADFPITGGMKVTLTQDSISKILHDSTGCRDDANCQLPSGDYWADSNMFPKSDTLKTMSDIMSNGMYLYSSIWTVPGPAAMDWVTNDKTGNLGPNDIDKATLTISNMKIKKLEPNNVA